MECTGIEGATPIPKWPRLSSDADLVASLSFGHYPEFLGIRGPSQDLNRKDNNPVDFLSRLWPASLCAMIAIETNRYAFQKGALNWHNTSAPEI